MPETSPHLPPHRQRRGHRPAGAVSLLTLGLGVLALGTLGAAAARAHGIQSNLEKVSPLSEQVRREFLLQSEFSTGEPAGDAAVRLWRADGETIEMGRTDAEGKLRFELPRGLSEEWEVQVDAGPGHRDYLELAEAGGNQPAGEDAAGPAEMVPLGRGSLLSWRSSGLGRLLARRPGGVGLPLVGGVAMGLSAAGAALLLQRRRR
jgi:nickel transport protein